MSESAPARLPARSAKSEPTAVNTAKDFALDVARWLMAATDPASGSRAPEWTRWAQPDAAGPAASTGFECVIDGWTVGVARVSFAVDPEALDDYVEKLSDSFVTRYTIAVTDPDGNVRGLADTRDGRSKVAKLFNRAESQHDLQSVAARRVFATRVMQGPDVELG